MDSVMATCERTVTDIVNLADDYADALIVSLSAVSSETMLHQVVAGTLLSFLAEAALLVQA